MKKNTLPSSENREIRVFLSSTFRDMQFERDYLIKTIFPEIRQACRKRQVEFTEIDLRWGVTKEEAEHGKVVRICLEEIDRCRPYFLGFMGERYGWEPADSDLYNLKELVHQFPLVEPSLKAKKSVTEMEILHGVLETPKMLDHAFFYLRAQQLTEAFANKTEKPAEFYDTDASAQAKLIDLKARVRQSGFPCHENYISLEALGEQIKVNLLAILEQRYPMDNVPSPLEADRILHQAYADDRCQSYLASSHDTGAIDAYIQSRAQNASTPPLIIGGESGLGKSALLAYWIGTYRREHPKCFFIQHFAGVSGDATPTSVLRRIMLEIKERNFEQDEVSAKPEDIVKEFPLWIAKVRANDPLLLVIDAINQIDGDNLNWLPDYIPPNVTLIVSSLPDSHYEQLQQRSWQTHCVLPLDDSRRKTLIQNYLETYRKSLSKEQTQTIANAPQCANPLFLITVLEELRVFGSFEKLDARINDYLKAHDLVTLFVKVLIRMEDDYRDKQQSSTVPAILKSLWAARKGLTETELIGITGINRQDLSNVLLAMDYHLSNKNGLRNFFHDHLRQAVRSRYLKTEEVQQAQHRKLANYFNQQMLDLRTVEELPWQWLQAKAAEKLKACLTGIPMFEQLYNKDPNELLSYWLSLQGCYDIIGKCYSVGFSKWKSPTEGIGTASMASKLGLFLMNQCKLYEEAEYWLRRALEIREKVLGTNHPDTQNSIINLAGVLESKGDYVDAMDYYYKALEITTEVFGAEHEEVVRLLNKLAKNPCTFSYSKDLYLEVLDIQKKRFDHNDPEVAIALINLAGGFDIEDSERAESLYREAWSIVETSPDLSNPKLADAIENLADLMSARRNEGDYATIGKMYSRALMIRRSAFGKAHPNLVGSLDKLAGLLQVQGHYAEAQQNLEEMINILEKSRGIEHPSVADALVKLADIQKKEGNKDDYANVENKYRRVLLIQKKAFGAEHPKVVDSLYKLAGFMQIQGQYDQAQQNLEEVISIQERTRGPEHGLVASSLIKYADLLCCKGDDVGAENAYLRALDILENEIENYHFVLPPLESLAVCYKTQGRNNEAHERFEQALHIREDLFGSNDIGVARLLNHIADLKEIKGAFDEARPLRCRAEDISNDYNGMEFLPHATGLDNLTQSIQGKFS